MRRGLTQSFVHLEAAQGKGSFRVSVQMEAMLSPTQESVASARLRPLDPYPAWLLGELMQNRKWTPLQGFHGPAGDGDFAGLPGVYHCVVYTVGTHLPIVMKAGERTKGHSLHAD